MQGHPEIQNSHLLTYKCEPYHVQEDPSFTSIRLRDTDHYHPLKPSRKGLRQTQPCKPGNGLKLVQSINEEDASQ
jgi:hypothetical protein